MALEAGELGFASVWLPDHGIDARMNKEVPRLENWTVLCAMKN
jgi:alkanesulfonate monooxygenase SsuD/methylene tetrahydromethanopterin reductase-like flavin-dependent oxidoreductase (luciferase family)